MTQILALKNIHKSFGAFKGVNDVSFSVSPGEIVSLLGPSGCGKTTTLRMIAGFEKPTSGEIMIAGKSALGLEPHERNVGLVFQHFALFPHMTIQDNIAYGLKYRNIGTSERDERVAEAVALVRLQGFEKRKPAQLSGGQQQRVALARAIVIKPSIMLLDEPLSALDAKLRETLQIELREILKSVNSATIIVTHDQEEAMSLGDRLIVMNKGRIEQEGTPQQVYRRPETEFVADFIGRASWMEGVITKSIAPGRASVQVAGVGEIEVATEIPTGTAVRLCIRPEHITIRRGGNNDHAGNAIQARVNNVLYLGSSVQVSLSGPGDTRLLVDVVGSEDAPVGVGDIVTIVFDPKDVSILRRTS